MGDRKERKRAEVHRDNVRLSVEDRIEEHVTRLVHTQPEESPGKKLHSVYRGTPTLLSWR